MIEEGYKGRLAALSDCDVVCGNTRLCNLLRLVDGDLIHIGDAILEGRDVLYRGEIGVSLDFSFNVKHYTIARPTIMIGDVECVKGETEALVHDETFYIPSLFCDHFYGEDFWVGYANDYKRLNKGLVFKKAEDAAAMAKALLKLTGQGGNHDD